MTKPNIPHNKLIEILSHYGEDATKCIDLMNAFISEVAEDAAIDFSNWLIDEGHIDSVSTRKLYKVYKSQNNNQKQTDK